MRALVAHTDPTVLHDFVFDPTLLEREVRSTVERHLRECVVCRKEHEQLVALRKELDAQEHVPGVAGFRGALRSAATWLGGRPTWAPALSAALMLLLLALPAYRGIYELPSARTRADELERELQRSREESQKGLSETREAFEKQLQAEIKKVMPSGTYQTAYLSDARDRGPSPTDAPVVQVRSGQSVVPISPVISEGFLSSLHGSYRAELLKDGAVVWSESLSSTDIRSAQTADPGAVMFLVPIRDVAPSRVVLRIASESHPRDVIFERTFMLVLRPGTE